MIADYGVKGPVFKSWPHILIFHRNKAEHAVQSYAAGKGLQYCNTKCTMIMLRNANDYQCQCLGMLRLSTFDTK